MWRWYKLQRCGILGGLIKIAVGFIWKLRVIVHWKLLLSKRDFCFIHKGFVALLCELISNTPQKFTKYCLSLRELCLESWLHQILIQNSLAFTLFDFLLFRILFPSHCQATNVKRKLIPCFSPLRSEKGQTIHFCVSGLVNKEILVAEKSGWRLT